MGCIYRHTRPHLRQAFVEEFMKKIEPISTNNTPVILLGDININVDDLGDSSNLGYVDMLESIGCRNLITSCTRFGRNRTGTISRSNLDHIVTNIDDSKIVAVF